MTSNWSKRTREEHGLLNPSFCSILIWHAAFGHITGSAISASLAFEEAFLVLPIVLHEETRRVLPKTTHSPFGLLSIQSRRLFSQVRLPVWFHLLGKHCSLGDATEYLI